ncbi:hypothetical protein CEP53_000425 [Fusarium sp. AF-6]|nr:hypothetical protein CEP53_000425 [Fusarium sp. AF-6]
MVSLLRLCQCASHDRGLSEESGSWTMTIIDMANTGDQEPTSMFVLAQSNSVNDMDPVLIRTKTIVWPYINLNKVLPSLVLFRRPSSDGNQNPPTPNNEL